MRFRILIPLLFLISSAFGQATFHNLVSDYERVAPVVASITVENASPNLLTVQFTDNSNLDTQVPDAGQWTVSGTAKTLIVTAQVINASARTLELSINGNITDADTPLLTYVNPGDGTGVRDVYYNYLASFSNTAVTNSTGSLPVFSGNSPLQWLFMASGYSGTSTIEDGSGNNLDADLVNSHCLTSNGTLVFTFSSLAGITITSSEGTSTPTIVGNTITTTAGTIYHIVLSNGSVIGCAEGSGSTAYDKVNSLNATLSGTVDWTGSQDTYHQNVRDGFSHYGRMDATNQYVALTTNLTPGTGKYSYKFIYAPDNITTTQDIAGTATTSTQLAIGTTAGAFTGTMRVGSSATTYTISCADNAATVGWANNDFSDIIWTRDPLGNVTVTINGFTLLLNGSASVVDATSITISQFMRTSTSNSNIGILKEVEILDTSNEALIGTKYNADNSFLGTLSGGFTTRKYPKPMGGDGANRNIAGVWHNAAETSVKINPTGDATLQTATGWTNTTELTYAQLTSSVIVDPSFINESDIKKKRNLATWTTALAYAEEKIANAFVGKTTINVNSATGFSGSNRFNYAAGSSYNANTTGFTVKIVVDGTGTIITTSQIIFGKTAAISGNGWAVELLADAAGSGLALRVKNGAGTVTRSRLVTFTEQETNLSIYHFVIRDGFMYSYRNGKKENTVITLTGITNGTDDLVLGGFSGGNGFAYGVISAAMYENKGMTDNEVEASYQATKNNVYVEEDGITLLFGSESGNANWVDRVGGSVTLTKTGTITITSMAEVFNFRWRPEDWPSDVNINSTTLPTADIGFVGDSRINGTFAADLLGFRNDFRTSATADGDISGVTMTGSQGSAPHAHYGLNGKSTGTLMSEAPGILSVNTTYDWDAIVLMLGTNAMTSSTLFNAEVIDEETLAFSFKRDLGLTTPIIWLSETEHDDAIRRARGDDLMYERMRLIARLKEAGDKIWHCEVYRALKIMDSGDFFDVVHPDDAGNVKINAELFPTVKRALGYTP